MVRFIENWLVFRLNGPLQKSSSNFLNNKGGLFLDFSSVFKVFGGFGVMAGFGEKGSKMGHF